MKNQLAKEKRKFVLTILSAGVGLLLAATPFSFALGQSAFSVSDALVSIDKDITSPVVYDYSSIYNDTGEPLNMRWIKRIDSPMVPGWNTFFQDPTAWHNPLEGLDSADFVLGVDTGIDDKLIFQVGHNMQIGSAQASFLIFPIDNRSDSVRVTYRVWVSDSPLPAGALGADQGGLVFPNPTNGHIKIGDARVKSLSFWDVSGKYTVLERSSGDSWDLSHLADGPYIIKLTYINGSHAYSRVVVMK